MKEVRDPGQYPELQDYKESGDWHANALKLTFHGVEGRTTCEKTHTHAHTHNTRSWQWWR